MLMVEIFNELIMPSASVVKKTFRIIFHSTVSKARDIDKYIRAFHILFYAGVTTLCFLSLGTRLTAGNHVADLDFCRLGRVMSETVMHNFRFQIT